MLDHSTDQRDWYLAQLKPHGARHATRHLERQGYMVFNPQHQMTQRRGERFVHRQMQLFPGYLFVGLDPERNRCAPINSTFGVSRLVGFGDGAVRLHFSLIETLRARCDAQDLLKPVQDQAEDPLRPGEQIRVIAGPFANFVSKIERIDQDQRIWLLLELMGRATRVHLQPTMVERLA